MADDIMTAGNELSVIVPEIWSRQFYDVLLAELPYASIWGHSPHYVQTTPNPRVSLALLTKLRSLVDFEIDMQELRLSAEAFETEVSKAIIKQSEISSYVQRLEQRHDAAHASDDDQVWPGRCGLAS